jgi:transposase
MRFIKLSDTELAELTDGYQNGKPFEFRKRCHCLILSHQGYTIPQLTQLFDVHRVTIYAWFDLWESNKSVNALRKKPGQGRRPKLSPTDPKR